MSIIYETELVEAIVVGFVSFHNSLLAMIFYLLLLVFCLLRVSESLVVPAVPSFILRKEVKYIDIPLRKVLPERTDSGIQSYLAATIQSSKVVLFSKNYCPNCVKIKKALNDFDVPFATVELDVSYVLNLQICVNDSIRLLKMAVLFRMN